MRVRANRAARLLAVVLAGAMIAAACSGDGDDNAPPSTTMVASASTSTAPAAPTAVLSACSGDRNDDAAPSPTVVAPAATTTTEAPVVTTTTESPPASHAVSEHAVTPKNENADLAKVKSEVASSLAPLKVLLQPSAKSPAPAVMVQNLMHAASLNLKGSQTRYSRKPSRSLASKAMAPSGPWVMHEPGQAQQQKSSTLKKNDAEIQKH